MSNYSTNNSFNDILERLLANVDDSLDKRQGSIIYDALAPAAAELAQCYIALDVYADQTYLATTTGKNLDNRAVDYGITRNNATKAQVKITTYDTEGTAMTVAIGTRFSTPNNYGGYNFKIISEITTGQYTAECETAGTVGNNYTGTVLPLVSVNNLGSAQIVLITKPGEDTETDDVLRKRIVTKLNQEAFAGNKAAYEQFTADIDGVDSCKVFPAWDGGGTVKIALIAPGHTIPNATLVNNVQTIIDPIPNQGEGIGIAPIGHRVTVVAPTELDVAITATITLEDGYTVTDVKTDVENQIKLYFNEVQDKFKDNDILTIYKAKLISCILNVTPISNVSDLYMDATVGSTTTRITGDLVITLTGTDIKYPIFDSITLTEGE